MDIAAMNMAAAAQMPASTPAQAVEVGYGGSLTSDITAFENSLNKAGADDASIAEVARTVFEPLDYLNSEAAALADFAQKAVESGGEMSPSEIISLTVKSQQFMYHSQLTANVANRTADGVQQLFRQQS